MTIIDKTPATEVAHDNIASNLIIHHTGGDGGFDTSNQTFEIVKAYHISLGWETIGYHYFIDKTGLVTQGRKDFYHGAHTKEMNMNNESLAVCLAGNFDLTLPTQAQIDSLRQLLVLKMDQYKIPKERIYPHRHFALNPNGTPYKSCFGNKLSDAWARDLITTEGPDKIKIQQAIDILSSLL